MQLWRLGPRGRQVIGSGAGKDEERRLREDGEGDGKERRETGTTSFIKPNTV